MALALSPLSCKGDGSGNANGFIDDAVVVQKVLSLDRSRRHSHEKRSHHFRRILQQIGSGLTSTLQTISDAYFTNSCNAGVTRGDLDAQIAFPFRWSAHVVENECEQVTIRCPIAHQHDRRDSQTFLVDLAT